MNYAQKGLAAFKERISLRLLAIVLGIILLWLIVVFAKVYFYPQPVGTAGAIGSAQQGAQSQPPQPQSVVSQIRTQAINGLIDTLPTFLLALLVMRLVERLETEGQVEQLVMSVLEGNRDKIDGALKLMSPAFRVNLISSAIEASLAVIGDTANAKEQADALVQSAVKPYLTGVYSFRLDFRADVIVRPMAQFLPVSGPASMLELLSRQKALYNWVYATTHYRQHGGVHNKKTDRIEACFAFDPMTLNKLFDRGEVFYREQLQVCSEFRDLLHSAPDEDLLNIFQELLQLKFQSTSGTELDLSMTVKREKYESGEIYLVSVPSIRDDGVAISFRLPQLASEREFLFAFPEPVLSPRVSINVESLPENTRLRFYTFVPATAEHLRSMDPTKKHMRLEFKGWILPRSGVLATWH